MIESAKSTVSIPVRGQRRLACLTFFFFLGMWLSKTVHPLYFDQHGHLVTFGVSYTAMAIAGVSSIFIGRGADRWGIRPVMLAGAVVYALGMALRVFYEPVWIAALSGLLAGLGASAVFVTMRGWILHHADEDHRPKFVARREFMTHAGTALGMGTAGVLAAWAGGGDHGHVLVLLLAALSVLIAATFTPPVSARATEENPENEDKRRGLWETLRIHRSLAVGVLGLGLMMGFYTSLLTPYLPLLLEERGVPLGLVGVAMAAVALARLATAAAAGSLLRRFPPRQVFFVTEVCCAFTTLVLALTMGPWIAAGVLILRAVFLVGATISQELLQMKAFPRALAGAFFGLVQSAFLAGDALGGSVGGLLYQGLGSTGAVLIATVVTAANAVLVPLFYGHLSKKTTTDVKELRNVTG